MIGLIQGKCETQRLTFEVHISLCAHSRLLLTILSHLFLKDMDHIATLSFERLSVCVLNECQYVLGFCHIAKIRT